MITIITRWAPHHYYQYCDLGTIDGAPYIIASNLSSSQRTDHPLPTLKFRSSLSAKPQQSILQTHLLHRDSLIPTLKQLPITDHRTYLDNWGYLRQPLSAEMMLPNQYKSGGFLHPQYTAFCLSTNNPVDYSRLVIDTEVNQHLTTVRAFYDSNPEVLQN